MKNLTMKEVHYYKLAKRSRKEYGPSKVCWRLKKTVNEYEQATRMFWNMILKGMNQ